jgi:hypothetical protein
MLAAKISVPAIKGFCTEISLFPGMSEFLTLRGKHRERRDAIGIKE